MCELKVEMDLAIIELALFLLVLLVIYKFLTRNDDFFKKRGVKFEKPSLLFGNLLPMFTGRETGMSLFENIYKKFDDEK